MKIAFLSRYFGVNDRGVETYVKELSKRLSEDLEVEILSWKDADSFYKMINGKFDVIIPTNGRMQSLKASLGRLFARYKLVIPGQSGIGRDDIWNILITRPNVYVALTEHELNWAKKWSLGTKLTKIPNGVDLKTFSSGGEKIKFDLPSPIILSVGALEWYKHHELAIEAVSLLDKGSLVIVGGGSKLEELNKLGQSKLLGRFKIMSVKFTEIAAYYRSADIFTLPSWDREAFGIVYIEAMASGLAVVAPNDSPRREIVGDAGIFVDVSNPSDYAKGIEKALNTSWQDKPRRQAEKFSWDKIAREYKSLLQGLSK